MDMELKYKVRINLTGELAKLLRKSPQSNIVSPLIDILKKHNAISKCQYDAFSDYVLEAEQFGVEDYPLYQWTKDTIGDPAKEEKYLKSFSLYVGGQEVYPKLAADDLEADLKLLVDKKVILEVFKYDTNPANSPQLPAKYVNKKS